MKSVKSIDELVQLGEKEIDSDVFLWRLLRNDGVVEAKIDSSKKSLIKLKNLSKELRFITEGYFDFKEMIWKDQSDGRALNANDWYQDSSHHMRQGFISKLKILF